MTNDPDIETLYRELAPHYREISPRALGFIYGRALGVPKDAAEYRAYETVARGLAGAGLKLTHAAWAIDMALRRVRDAETAAEQLEAMAELRVVFHAQDRDVERVESGPVKFFRYGRVGNVLRRFVPKSWTGAHNV